MAKYCARSCPNCNYYVGFSVAKPLFNNTEAYVTSFCLNCNYKLPMHAVVRGVRRSTPTLRRRALRLVRSGIPAIEPRSHEPQDRNDSGRKVVDPSNYTRHLRAIGQDLEKLRLTSFNLQCIGDNYLVWARNKTDTRAGNPLPRFSKNRWQKLWRYRKHTQTQVQEDDVIRSSSYLTKRLHYSFWDIDRIEQQGRGRRRERNSTTRGHSLSELLRTVGELLGQRRERLLGISWQEFTVSIVVESNQGRREIHVFRPDNLYNLCVKMYLRRDHWAFSDMSH